MESLLIILMLVAMCASLLLILIPAVPVSALEWALALIFAVSTGFTRLTPLAAIIITVFMVLGSTSGFWMPFLGMKGREMSCLGIIAFFVGMIVGSFLIPIPFIGTLLGGMITVILVEFARFQEWRTALKGGQAALKTILLSMVAEFIFALAIVGTTIVSIWLTA